MMTQSLAQEFDTLVKYDRLTVAIPEDLTNNLASNIELRPYQIEAFKRFLFYIDSFQQCPANPQLLFQMATGSGKTILMAVLILELYRRGYRNFLFFVNSAQIIEKTKDNFLNPASTKHLFASQIRINGKTSDIREVDTFDAVHENAINIHFTTIQGLHMRMQDPKENSVTIEDFRDHKVVMISDEAHHINVETKKTLTKGEAVNKASWEWTVFEIFQQHPENMLLEFTATADLSHKAIQDKYHDKILYDYSLRQFREDGYSKDIELRQADLPAVKRMMQAMVLSQYRRKVAETHGIQCKPVILMKSRTIKESAEHEAAFTTMVAGLTADKLNMLRSEIREDETLSRALTFIFDERALNGDEFARELQGDFAAEKVVNVNNPKDLQDRQIELNELESRDNEVRVIFAVDKLNEGWDVLNLFDIVRLYNTRDGRANKVGKTTMAEAQLIGRGARYFPFVAPDQPEAEKEKRKYDSATDNQLRILEELHYHCYHNPPYIHDIRNALRQTGMLDETARTVKLRLKDSFKQTSLYKREFIWMNDRERNPRDRVSGLDAYKIQSHFIFPNLMTGRVTEDSAFDGGRFTLQHSRSEPISLDFKLINLGLTILRFAMDAINFFHFTNLRSYFPRLSSTSQFITSKNYLGGTTVTLRGLQEDLKFLTVQQKLDIALYVLNEIEKGVKLENIEYVGTKVFKPYRIIDRFTDKSLKLRIEGESGLSWSKSHLPGLDQIDLGGKDWHVYDDSYGTDQEKHFIKFVNDQAERLTRHYEEFYLLRNEKAVKLYDFQTGRGFEPDFVLFLRKKGQETSTIMQLFIEPKGDHLMELDEWKQNFLGQLKEMATIETVFQGRHYIILGLPFFNEGGQTNADLRAAFEDEVFRI